MCDESVSLCLLTYNRSEVLERSIDSLLSQTYDNFELIINDDCSTDGTRKIGEQYQKQHDHVRYEKNENNLMLAGNANIALQRSNNELVGIVHDGDIYEPFMLERWIGKMLKYPSSAFVFHGHYLVKNGKPLLHKYPEFIEGKKLLKEMLLRWHSPVYGICMLRKSMVEKVGGYDERYPFISDVDLYMKLLRQFDATYVKEPLVANYEREDNHEYKGVHWGFEENIFKIRKRNADKSSLDPLTAIKVWISIYYQHTKRIPREFVKTIIRGKFDKTKEGIKVIKRCIQMTFL